VTAEVEVLLDADFLEGMRVGTLSHDRGTLCFAYYPVCPAASQRPAFARSAHTSASFATFEICLQPSQNIRPASVLITGALGR
jgi:hypothetical protein